MRENKLTQFLALRSYIYKNGILYYEDLCSHWQLWYGKLTKRKRKCFGYHQNGKKEGPGSHSVLKARCSVVKYWILGDQRVLIQHTTCDNVGPNVCFITLVKCELFYLKQKHKNIQLYLLARFPWCRQTYPK